MIKKTLYALTLILVGLAMGACGSKEEDMQSQEEATSAIQMPTITPGEMVLVPAGEYTIGNNDKDLVTKDYSNAYPEHKVTLPAFWIDKYEVTNSEYLDFSINTSYIAEGEKEGKTWRTFFSPEKAKVPVVYITWKDAEAYCKALGKRLPTEEEWEAAARGPEAFRFPWGNEWEPGRTNTLEAGYRVPVDIGTFDDVSPFGVHDMFGNVQEWTASQYKAYPKNPKSGAQEYHAGYYVLRGLGSRYTNAKASGLWARTAYPPNYLADFGCRCAKDATPEEGGAPAK